LVLVDFGQEGVGHAVVAHGVPGEGLELAGGAEEAGADGPKIRGRYTELVRRLHPDANGGDRAGERRLQKVIRAYQTLRKAGMV
jgi:hypothetical protein